jgi:hypothetical protein
MTNQDWICTKLFNDEDFNLNMDEKALSCFIKFYQIFWNSFFNSTVGFIFRIFRSHFRNLDKSEINFLHYSAVSLSSINSLRYSLLSSILTNHRKNYLLKIHVHLLFHPYVRENLALATIVWMIWQVFTIFYNVMKSFL